MTLASLNRALDAIPRTRVGRLSREVPAFRTAGITGYYLAVATTLGAALLAGRGLLPAAGLLLVCGLSFFLQVYLRRWMEGSERLVLMQQVWQALALSALGLWALGLPVLPWLDVLAPGVAVFLAGGRVACTLAGCCHGRPSALGLRYGDEHAADGFPPHLVGVRLFPVQLVECAGLVVIAATSFVAIPFAAEGRVFAWFLASYAVLRFGTEALRGDPRPHALGLSQPRWMALVQLAVAMAITRDPARPVADAVVFGVLLAALAGSLAAMRHFDARPALLSAAHGDQVREVARALAALSADGGEPRTASTSRGAVVGVSTMERGVYAVSLGVPVGTADVRALCTLAVAAFPRQDTAFAVLTPGGRLLMAVPAPIAEVGGPPPAGAADALLGTVLRRAQAVPAADAPGDGLPPPPVPAPTVSREGYFGTRPVFVRPAGAGR